MYCSVNLGMAFALTLGCFLAACQSRSDITGSIGVETNAAQFANASDDQLRAYADSWRARYEANTGDRQAAINYARTLRALTQYSQAVAILQSLAVKFPNDLTVLGEYGKALVDSGRWKEAEEVLPKAHHPENPNWTILSAQGIVADELDEHELAQQFYQSALKIVPGEPSLLSNLAMSYILSKKLGLAEQCLRQALQNPRADIRVRQNLVFALALEGKNQEAYDIAQKGVSAQESASIIMAVRTMLAAGNNGRTLINPITSSTSNPNPDARTQRPKDAKNVTVSSIGLQSGQRTSQDVASQSYATQENLRTYDLPNTSSFSFPSRAKNLINQEQPAIISAQDMLPTQ